MYSMNILSSCLAFASLTLVHSDTGPNEMVCDGKVIARLPPSISKQTNPKFVDTPRGYFSGLFYQTYSSTLATAGVRNVQLVSVYDVAADVTSDITSFQVGTCPHIYTVFATDMDTPRQDDEYPLHLPGTNMTFVTDILAYGLDTKCHRYFVTFGGDPAPGITISSQVESGPTEKTLNAIEKALIALGNKQVTGETKKIGKVADDGKRTGFPDFVCGAACQNNQNTYDGTCAGA